MICGVALVAQEMNKGPRLVFRYPDHNSDYLKSRILSLLSKSQGMEDPKASKSNPKAHYIGKICSQYENLSDESFAKLFKEKLSFMGRAAEFSIEDIVFTSFAFPAQHLSVERDNTTSDTPQMQPLFSSFTFVLISINPVFLKSIFPDLSLASHQKAISFAGEDPLNSALARRTLRPTAYCSAALKRIVETLGHALAEQEKKTSYISDETALLLKCQEPNRRSISGSFNSNNNTFAAPSPVMFQEEFILIPDFDAVEYETPVNSENNSFKHESTGHQNNVSFSGDLPEMFEGDDLDRTEEQSMPAKISRLQSFTSDIDRFVSINDKDERRYEIFLHCLLANELRVFFHAVTGGRAFHFRLHHTSPTHAKLISIHFICKEPTLLHATNSTSNGMFCEETLLFANAEADFRRMKPTIVWTSESSTRRARSTNLNNNSNTVNAATATTMNSSVAQCVAASATHVNFVTLLLLAETDTVLETLSSVSGSNNSTTSSNIGNDGDHQHNIYAASGKMALSNSRIKDFIESADPTKSMLDLAVLLDEPVEELLSMAHYLQNLGLGELIPVLHRRSVFAVHPFLNASLTKHSCNSTSSSTSTSTSTCAAQQQVVGAFQTFLTHLARVSPTTPVPNHLFQHQQSHHNMSHVSHQQVHFQSHNPNDVQYDAHNPGTNFNHPNVFKGVTLASVLAAFDGQRSLDEIISQSHSQHLSHNNSTNTLAGSLNGNNSLFNTPLHPSNNSMNNIGNNNNNSGADGHQTTTRGNNVWPYELRRYVMPVVLFLLRWHLIVHVDWFLVDSKRLCDEVEVGMQRIANERKLLSSFSSNNVVVNANNNNNEVNGTNGTNQNKDDNFGLGRVPLLNFPPNSMNSSNNNNSLHRNNSGVGFNFPANSMNNLNSVNNNSYHFNHNLSHYEWSVSRAIQQELSLCQNNNSGGAFSINNAGQYTGFGNKFVAGRSVGELAVLLRVPEADILRALRHLPHVRIVTKPLSVQHL